MKIALNELKKYLNAYPSDQEIIELIGSRLVEVEEVIDFGQKYQGLKIVQVIKSEPIEGTHLTLCQIKTDSSNRLTQVVCGAPNVYNGMFAVWIPPSATVPATFHKEPFVLSEKKLRGYLSAGMLAGLDELDLGDDHSGIVEIDPNFAPVGADFAKAFGLNDQVLDIDNKSLTHRADCFGLIGFARELSAILDQQLKIPVKKKQPEQLPPLPIGIDIDEKICYRYSLAHIKLSPASKFLNQKQVFLAKAGIRSVSPIVDLINYHMLITGQPLHAFDYHKVLKITNGQPHFSVRLAHPEESLLTLDNKTLSLKSDDIVIVAGQTPIALAGAIGGLSTAADQNTTEILLESATFNFRNLRKTQMSHGIFTEAITRCTKHQSPFQTLDVLLATASDLGQLIALADFYPRPQTANSITLSLNQLNQLLPAHYQPADIKHILELADFKVESSSTDDQLLITPPSHRTDIGIPEDLIEEVARLKGYDNIPATLPLRPIKSAHIHPLLKLKSNLRTFLSDNLSAHEILTYSFVSHQLLQRVGLDSANCYQITNSLSAELEFFRPSLLPSLIDKVYQNLRARHQDFALYEFNQVATKPDSLPPNFDPTTSISHHLAYLALTDFFTVKNHLLLLAKRFHLNIEFSAPDNSDLPPYFASGRTALITADGNPLGYFGELDQRILAQFKLKAPISAFELDLEAILKYQSRPQLNYKAQKFPSSERDLSLKVASDLSYQIIISNLTASLPKDFDILVKPISLYSPEPDSQTKTISFRLKISHPDKTLTSTEISAIIDQTTNKLKSRIDFELI